MRSLRPHSFAALTGVLTGLAVGVPATWPLAFVALVPLLRALDAPAVRPRRALALGWTAGLVTQAVGTYWLVETLARFSGHPWPVALPLALGAWLAEGGRFALFAWLLRVARPHGAWVAPAAWAALEWAYPSFLPWQLATGLGAVPVLVQTADLGGATLVSAAVVAVNASVACALGDGLRARPALPIAALATWVLALGYGAYRIGEVDARIETAAHLDVGLVQPTFDTTHPRARTGEPREGLLAGTDTITGRTRPALLVWPESSIAGALDAETTTVPALAGVLDAPVLLGAVGLRTGGDRPGLYNTAWLVAPDGRVLGRHDKRRLVPFGEHIPFADALPWLRSFAPNAGRFRPGDAAPPLVVGGVPMRALICYEDTLPDLVRTLVRDDAPRLLVNLTNDAWFGDSTAADIHFALARLRAVEHHRALVRATNTGRTAVVDPVGRVVAAAPAFEPATLTARVPLLDAPTLYTRLGDWPAWLGLCITLLIVAHALGVPRATRWHFLRSAENQRTR